MDSVNWTGGPKPPNLPRVGPIRHNANRSTPMADVLIQENAHRRLNSTVSLSIAEWPLFKLGHLWRNGRAIRGYPDDLEYATIPLDVPGKLFIGTAYAGIDTDHYLIPPDTLRIPSTYKNSKVLWFKRDGRDTWGDVIIPRRSSGCTTPRRAGWQSISSAARSPCRASATCSIRELPSWRAAWRRSGWELS